MNRKRTCDLHIDAYDAETLLRERRLSVQRPASLTWSALPLGQFSTPC
jgi:hypothetical protein